MTPLAAKAGEIGGEVKEVTLLLEAAFKQERGVLDVMSKCKVWHPTQRLQSGQYIYKIVCDLRLTAAPTSTLFGSVWTVSKVKLVVFQTYM